MSIDKKKALYRRMQDEFFNKGNLDLVDEVFAATRRESIKGYITAVRAAFPDLRVEVNEIVVEGDWTAWRRTMSGTHQGEWLGIPATGREVTWQEMLISHMVDDQIVEEWYIPDRLDLLRQFGVLPPQEELVERAKSKQA